MAKLSDIIALAKAGYKVKEINKMLEEEKEENKTDATSTSVDDTNASLSTDDETSTPDEDDVEVDLSEQEDTTDYKALYEEQKKQLEDAKKKLKIAQQVNVRQPVENGKEQTEEEFYEDLANAFL